MNYNHSYLLLLLLLLNANSCSLQDQQKEPASLNTPVNSNLIAESGLADTITLAMTQYGLKGLSAAVFQDYEIIWTETWGVKDTISNDSIDKETAFSAASIAKPITATLFTLLEYKNLIDLKTPVKDYLKRWQLPESELTAGVEVTLEQLLSHTSGTSQHGFWDFYVGDTLPTMIQSLNGEIGDNERLHFRFRPGTNWSYSGGGYVIAQLAVEDYLGQSLAQLAEDHLFEPLKLTNTTFRQPNEPGFLFNVAKAHDNQGSIIRTGIPITPQIAPSGLWTTPHDMAVFMMAMQRALDGDSSGVIPPTVAMRVTDVVTTYVMGGWSLGWERRYGYGNYQWFSHGGANTGIGGHIYATMEGGKGITMFGNGPNGVRIPVLDLIRDKIVEICGWYRPLDTSGEQELSDELVEEISGTYANISFGDQAELKASDQGMIFENFVPGKAEAELVYIGDRTFLVNEYPSTIRFEVFNDTLHVRPKHRAFDKESGYNYRKIN